MFDQTRCARCGDKVKLAQPMARPLCGACISLIQHAISGPSLTEAERMERAMAYRSGNRIAGNS